MGWLWSCGYASVSTWRISSLCSLNKVKIGKPPTVCLHLCWILYRIMEGNLSTHNTGLSYFHSTEESSLLSHLNTYGSKKRHARHLLWTEPFPLPVCYTVLVIPQHIIRNFYVAFLLLCICSESPGVLNIADTFRHEEILFSFQLIVVLILVLFYSEVMVTIENILELK